MKSSTLLKLILSYAIVLIPGCKQRSEEMSSAKSGITKKASVDYDQWFDGISGAAKKDNAKVGETIEKEFRGMHEETVVGNDIKVYSIDPDDLSSKKLLRSPSEFQPEANSSKKLFLQVPTRPDNYFTVEVMKSNVTKTSQKNAKVLVRVYSDIYGKGELELIDGEVSQMQLYSSNDETAKNEIRSMMNEFSAFNARYVASEKSFGLADKDEGISTYDRMRMFVGIIVFGIATAGYSMMMLGVNVKSVLPFIFLMGFFFLLLFVLQKVVTSALRKKMDILSQEWDVR